MTALLQVVEDLLSACSMDPISLLSMLDHSSLLRLIHSTM